MIRVAVVDDHPALRAGLKTVLDAEPDIVLVGESDRIKHDVPAPRIIVFTAYASPALALPATLARADGILAKGAGARDLFSAIRLVCHGEKLLPQISAKVLEEASTDLLGEDKALVGMLLDGASEADIAHTLSQQAKDVRHAVQRILSALRLDVPAARAE